MPIGATSSEIEEAVRRVMPDVLKRAACYARLTFGSSEEHGQKIIHEAIYSKNTFRPAAGHRGQGLKPVYRGNADQIAVRQARAKRRRYLKEKIIFELEAALQRSNAAEIRRTVIEQLIETDDLELDWRKNPTQEQHSITEQLNIYRRRLVVETLGVDTAEILAACKHFLKSHPERAPCTLDQVWQFAVTKYINGERVPFLRINRQVLELTKAAMNCAALMPPRISDVQPGSP